MTPDARSSTPDLDDEEHRFLADIGLSAPGASPWRGCPELPLLLAAEEGTLPPDAQRGVEAHVAACAFCRSLVQDVKDAELGAPAAEELERIRARVRASDGANGPTIGAAPRRWTTSVPLLALAASVAAAVGLGVYALSLQRRADALEGTLAPLRAAAAQSQQHMAVLEGQLAALRAQAEQPGGEANVPVVDLEPLGARRSSEGARGFSLPPNARFVTLILQMDGAGNAGNVGVLTVEIRDARGELRWSIDGLQPSAAGVVTALVPRGTLPDGEAVITLVRTRDGRRLPVAEYRARFERP